MNGDRAHLKDSFEDPFFFVFGETPNNAFLKTRGKEGLLTILEGEPGAGKTLFSLKLANHLTARGKNVVFIPLEQKVGVLEGSIEHFSREFDDDWTEKRCPTEVIESWIHPGEQQAPVSWKMESGGHVFLCQKPDGVEKMDAKALLKYVSVVVQAIDQQLTRQGRDRVEFVIVDNLNVLIPPDKKIIIEAVKERGTDEGKGDTGSQERTKPERNGSRPSEPISPDTDDEDTAHATLPTDNSTGTGSSTKAKGEKAVDEEAPIRGIPFKNMGLGEEDQKEHDNEENRSFDSSSKFVCSVPTVDKAFPLSRSDFQTIRNHINHNCRSVLLIIEGVATDYEAQFLEHHADTVMRLTNDKKGVKLLDVVKCRNYLPPPGGHVVTFRDNSIHVVPSMKAVVARIHEKVRLHKLHSEKCDWRKLGIEAPQRPPAEEVQNTRDQHPECRQVAEGCRPNKDGRGIECWKHHYGQIVREGDLVCIEGRRDVGKSDLMTIMIDAITDGNGEILRPGNICYGAPSSCKLAADRDPAKHLSEISSYEDPLWTVNEIFFEIARRLYIASQTTGLIGIDNLSNMVGAFTSPVCGIFPRNALFPPGKLVTSVLFLYTSMSVEWRSR